MTRPNGLGCVSHVEMPGRKEYHPLIGNAAGKQTVKAIIPEIRTISKPLGGEEPPRHDAPPSQSEIQDALQRCDSAAIFSMITIKKIHPDQMKTSNNTTVLTVAIANGDAILVENLLTHGANPNLVKDCSYLHSAITKDVDGSHLAIIRLLLKHGANPNTREGAHEQPPLHLAAGDRVASAKITETLLKNGADPNLCDLNGRHSLFPAVATSPPNRQRILTALVLAGAKPEICDNDGLTVSDHAKALDNNSSADLAFALTSRPADQTAKQS